MTNGPGVFSLFSYARQYREKGKKLNKMNVSKSNEFASLSAPTEFSECQKSEILLYKTM